MLADDERVLEEVLELANVSGPVVHHEQFQDRFRNAAHVLGKLVIELFHEVLDEERYIVAPLPERRNFDLHHLEAEKEVLAEIAGLHPLLEVAVGRRDHPYVHSHRRRVADSLELHGFEDPEQTKLHTWGHFADLVEEDRAAIRSLESADLVLDRVGEGAADVAEELAFEETFGEGGAVDFDEILVTAVARGVEGVGHKLLACTTLSGQEDRGADVGKRLDHRKDAADAGARADDPSELL